MKRPPTWFDVTTWADRDWKAAQEHFWESWSKVRGTIFEQQSHEALAAARAEYRHRVLSWYWKLLVPMQPGHCVPESVSTLLAEDWDERTKWRPAI